MRHSLDIDHGWPEAGETMTDQPLDVLLAEVKELECDCKCGCQLYAHRTLLPGLAEMVEEAKGMGDIPVYSGKAIANRMNALAADLLAKLEPKETDDGPDD